MRPLVAACVASAACLLAAAAYSDDPAPTILASGLGKDEGAAAVSADGKWLAAGDATDAVRLYDVASGKLVRSLVRHRCGIAFLAFAGGDSDALVSLGDETDCVIDRRKNVLCFWRTSSGTVREELDATPVASDETRTDRHVRLLAVCPKTSDAAVLVGDRVVVHDVAGKRRSAELAGERLGLTDALVFSPDGLRLLAIRGRHGGLAFARADAASEWKPDGPVDVRGALAVAAWTGIAFSPDGKTLFGVGAEPTSWVGDKPSRGADWLCAWDAATGEGRWELRAAYEARRFVVSPRGDALFVPWGDQVLVLDPATGRTARTLGRPPAAARAFAVSSDGRSLYATTADGSLVRWNVGDGK